MQRVFIGEAALIQFTALIGRTGDVSQAVVSLTANGREILHRPVALPDKVDKISVITQWEADPSAWLQGSLSVTAKPDDLPLDDTCYFTVPPITEGRVALLSDSVYLQTALSGKVAHGHWKVEQLNPTKLSDANIATPDTYADILMVDGDYLQSAQARTLVDHYLAAGRGRLHHGRQALDAADRLPGGNSASIRRRDSPPAPMHRSRPSAISRPTRPSSSRSSCPIFATCSRSASREPAHLGAREAKPILFGQNGDALLFDGTKDNGRYLLTTFAFDRKQTNWVIDPSFVPFLDSALQYLRPQATLNSTLEPGEIWLAQLPPDANVKTVVLSAGGKEFGRAPVNADHRALVRAPADPGLYGLSYDQDPAVRQMLAVNPSEKESELNYFTAPPDIVKAWTMSDPHKPATPGGGCHSRVDGDRFQRQHLVVARSVWSRRPSFLR